MNPAIANAVKAIDEEIVQLQVVSNNLKSVAGRIGAPAELTIVPKSPATPQKSRLTTVEMVRQILNTFGKPGEEMSYEELRSAIRTTFQVEPATSLNQMVYKRAHKRGGEFYRTKDGKFGLSSWKKPEEKTAAA